ncbi:MAG: penicillin acylase family protein [Dehalococcoidia bacterium]
MSSSITRADLEASLPDTTATLRLPGLQAGAAVHRDRWGIPHIRAENEHDLFFAQGFATAQDRLWHMDYDRMRCLGRSAEYLGKAGLPQDRLMRRRRLDRAAHADYAMCSDEARVMLDAYAAGVNAFLESDNPLPVEYSLLGMKPERWEPWHCIVVYKVRNTAEGSFQSKLWLARFAAAAGAEKAAKLTPGYPQGHLLTVPPGAVYNGPVLNALDELSAAARNIEMLQEVDGGSNGWAISGDRTESGLPLVAGDSHRGLDTPNVYSQVHLSCPDFTVIGHAVPGMAGALHFCHNEHVAWGMTHGSCDTQDLFVEQFRDNGGQLEYLFMDQWMPVQVSAENLKVRDSEDERLDVAETHHGPVVAGDPTTGWGVALADPGSRDGTRWVDAARDAMRAKSADEFEEALANWTDRVNNYPYADVNGNFGYTLRGRIPVRPSSNGWGPVPGWTGEHEWQGYIPAAELPRTRNPEQGYVVTCNQRIVDETYEHYLGHSFTPDYRARRITERLQDIKDRKAGVDDMAAVHAERVSAPALSFLQAVKDLEPGSDLARKALGLLTEWNGSMDRDSAGAAVYAALNAEAVAALARFHYGELAADALSNGGAGGDTHMRREIRPRFLEGIAAGDVSLLPDGESVSAFLSAALDRAVEDLRRRLGDDPAAWRWGDLHHTEHSHPLSAVFPGAADLLNPPKVQAHGDGDTPLAGSHVLAGGFTIGSGSVNRYVHDPSNWTNSRWIVPLGASGHPGSPHFADQQETWSNVETIPQLWDWRQIEAEAEATQRLEPGE